MLYRGTDTVRTFVKNKIKISKLPKKDGPGIPPVSLTKNFSSFPINLWSVSSEICLCLYILDCTKNASKPSFFWSVFSHSFAECDYLQIESNTGKCKQEKSRYLDTFYEMLLPRTLSEIDQVFAVFALLILLFF